MSAKLKVALLSVYNKEGIVQFAQGLRQRGYRILASGGTAKTLKSAGVPVQDVAKLVGGKAILGHRVVTLSREVHAGLLARFQHDGDIAEMEQLGLPYIDLVCVDMYPLTEAIAKEGATVDSVIESTDIGGPTMLRSAAKGGRLVICDPAGRKKLLGWIDAGEPDRDQMIEKMRAKVERTVGEYCLASAKYHSGDSIEWVVGDRVAGCCYGENKIQSPAYLYSSGTIDPLAVDQFRQIGGSAPSYNNFCDIDRMVATMCAAVSVIPNSDNIHMAIAVKHGNPCGAAYGDDQGEVLRKLVDGDHLAIFGGSVMTNFPLGLDGADELMLHGMDSGRRMLDCIVAPDISPVAIEAMGRKGDKCRFFVNLALLGRCPMSSDPVIRPVRGGFLVQPAYQLLPELTGPDFYWEGQRISEQEELDLRFAWAIGSTSNSNTVTLVRDGMLVGNGVGQQARVYGARLAVERAGERAKGAVAYSDSFFPEIDGPQVLAEAGVKAVLTSSGSVRDEDVLKYCRQVRMTVVMAPDSLIRGFYRH